MAKKKFESADPNTWSRWVIKQYVKQNLPGYLRITTDTTTAIDRLLSYTGITDDKQAAFFIKIANWMVSRNQLELQSTLVASTINTSEVNEFGDSIPF